MNKKNEKRLCWNCDGSVSLHLNQCPYCGVDLTSPGGLDEETYKNHFASPFQTSLFDESPPPSPFGVEEQTLIEESVVAEEEDLSPTTRKEIIALLLFLPGIIFMLFGAALLLFSSDGMLTLRWKESFAYFYFIGSAPLLYLGYRALR